jgi:hypothetical protein
VFVKQRQFSIGLESQTEDFVFDVDKIRFAATKMCIVLSSIYGENRLGIIGKILRFFRRLFSSPP